jgi:hypothetical protein
MHGCEQNVRRSLVRLFLDPADRPIGFDVQNDIELIVTAVVMPLIAISLLGLATIFNDFAARHAPFDDVLAAVETVRQRSGCEQWNENGN